jgi:hypothetical protein
VGRFLLKYDRNESKKIGISVREKNRMWKQRWEVGGDGRRWTMDDGRQCWIAEGMMGLRALRIKDGRG